MANSRSAPPSTRRPPRRLLLGAVTLIALLLLALVVDLRGTLHSTLEWIRDLGPLGVLAYGLVYISTVLLMVPATFLTLAAGATFGVAVGFPLVWFSATAGATFAFALGRSLARRWVEHRLTTQPRLAALDHAVGKSGWRIVLLSRLCPFFPFTLLNYAYGLTKISLPHYSLATAIGLFPGVLLYVWIGDKLGDLAGMNPSSAVPDQWQWVFYAVGIATALLVTLYVGRLAQKALNEAVALSESTPPPAPQPTPSPPRDP